MISVPLMAEVSHVVSDKEIKMAGRSAGALAYGFQNCAFAAGTILGPVWGGMMVDHLSWGAMGWTLGLLCGVTALPVVMFLGRKK